jgi:hypothetical protein
MELSQTAASFFQGPDGVLVVDDAGEVREIEAIRIPKEQVGSALPLNTQMLEYHPDPLF